MNTVIFNCNKYVEVNSLHFCLEVQDRISYLDYNTLANAPDTQSCTAPMSPPPVPSGRNDSASISTYY